MSGVKLAYYKRTDWKRFLSMIDDQENMHEHWEDWYKAFKKTKKSLTKKGLNVLVCIVDIDLLDAYCKKNEIKNDGKARSQFVQAV